MIELNHLRTFLAVSRCGSVTRAARTLHTTPPTVSAQIKALEEALDVTLFERTSKGMQLTQKGAALRDKADQVLQAEKDLVAAAAGFKSATVTRLSVGLNADSSFAPCFRVSDATGKGARYQGVGSGCYAGLALGNAATANADAGMT